MRISRRRAVLHARSHELANQLSHAVEADYRVTAVSGTDLGHFSPGEVDDEAAAVPSLGDNPRTDIGVLDRIGAEDRTVGIGLNDPVLHDEGVGKESPRFFGREIHGDHLDPQPRAHRQRRGQAPIPLIACPP